jgi:hypothetical protein
MARVRVPRPALLKSLARLAHDFFAASNTYRLHSLLLVAATKKSSIPLPFLIILLIDHAEGFRAFETPNLT